MTDNDLEEWSESAASIGDIETMLIAEIALGRGPRINWEAYALSPRRRANLRRLTVSGARRQAGRWG